VIVPARLNQAYARYSAVQTAIWKVDVRYNFEVLRGDEVVVAERLLVTGLGDVWSRIARLSENVAESGCQIRVTEEAGGIAILIGAAAARSLRYGHISAARPKLENR
jgi:hypothetical protein